MATFKTKLLKSGVYSGTIQVKIKNSETGKYEFKSKTVRIPANNKTEHERTRYLNKISVIFEDDIRKNALTRQKRNKEIVFSELADQWHKYSYGKDSDSYYYRTEKIIEYLNGFLGNILVKEIMPSDIQNIIFKLNTTEYEVSKAVLIKSLDEIIEKMKIKNICNNGGFTKTTFQFVRKGKTIDWLTAVGVAKALNIEINDYFKKVSVKKKYEKETKLKYKRTLCAILNYGIKCGYLSNNYCSGFYTKGVISGEKKEKVILNQKEVYQLENGLNTYPNLKKRAYVSVLLFLGVRNCEACGLEWKDIDFENNKLSIQRDSLYIKEKGTYTAKTKNDYSKRTLKIPQKLLNVLKEYKIWYDNEKERLGDYWVESDRLFIRENGAPCNPTSCNKWLSEILVANGLKKVSPHSLRHTNITMLLRNGVPVKIVCKWAGHANASVTLSTYAHFLDEDENTSADCIDKIFSNEKEIE